MPQLSYKRPALTQPPRLLRALQVVLAVLLGLCTDALVSPVATFAGATAFTSTRLASTNNSSRYGEPVTFIAAVFWGSSAGTPTGTVIFTDGTTVLGNVSLDSNSRAVFTTSSLAAGSHSIAASYVPADPLLFSGSSTTFTQNVTSTAAVTTLASTPNPSTFGQPVTLIAAVRGSGGTPAGTVTFTDGATALGTASLDYNGQATFITSALTVGRHTIIANYGGAPNFVDSKGMLSQMVNPKIPAPGATQAYRPLQSPLWTRAQHRALNRSTKAIEVRDRTR